MMALEQAEIMATPKGTIRRWRKSIFETWHFPCRSHFAFQFERPGKT
jgi:hypothetical protein